MRAYIGVGFIQKLVWQNAPPMLLHVRVLLAKSTSCIFKQHSVLVLPQFDHLTSTRCTNCTAAHTVIVIIYYIVRTDNYAQIKI